DEVVAHIQKDDFIVIEGFGFASQQAIQSGGIGWGIRMALARNQMKYFEVAPNALKKFVNVTGWIGEPGNKKRLKGKEKKDAVMDAVKEHFGFEHTSDNVADAYVMAQIVQSIATSKVVNDYMKEIDVGMINQQLKKKKKKARDPK